MHGHCHLPPWTLPVVAQRTAYVIRTKTQPIASTVVDTTLYSRFAYRLVSAIIIWLTIIFVLCACICTLLLTYLLITSHVYSIFFSDKACLTYYLCLFQGASAPSPPSFWAPVVVKTLSNNVFVRPCIFICQPQAKCT